MKMTIQESLHRIGQIARRETRRMTSQPVYLFGMIVAPLICLVFFLSLMREGLPTNLPVAVVDMDNSATSRTLIRQLDAFEQTKVVMLSHSFTEARQEMQKGNVYGIFYIPEDFAKEATSGKQPKLSYYTNNTYLIAASLLFRDMKTVSVLANGSVGLQLGTAKGKTEAEIMGQLQPIVIDTHAIGNPWLNYSVYLNNTILPGVLQLMIFLITVFSIGTELKNGTARKWMAMGKNSLVVSLLGKLLPQTFVFTLVGFLFMAVLYGFSAFPLTKYATAPPSAVTASAMYQPRMQKLCFAPLSSNTNSPLKRSDRSFHCSSGMSTRMACGSSCT